MNDNELMHYGVPGMKWGVHKYTTSSGTLSSAGRKKISTMTTRVARKQARNDKLTLKANKFDKKAAVATKKSERIHAKIDLESANRYATKSANYYKKAAKLRNKAEKSPNDFDQSYLARKAARKEYKGAKLKMEANKISKTKGYGVEAMKYSIKSDNFKKKAAKARMKIQNNEYYMKKMNVKIDSLSALDIAAGKQQFQKED